MIVRPIWQEMLNRLVRLSLTDDRNDVFQAELPTSLPLPASLISCSEIQQFYEICDGGTIGFFWWYSKNQIESKTSYWLPMINLINLKTPLILESCLVLGETFGGEAVIWDSVSQKIFLFFADGGDWEENNQTFNSFINNVFHPSSKDTEWFKLVEKLKVDA